MLSSWPGLLVGAGKSPQRSGKAVHQHTIRQAEQERGHEALCAACARSLKLDKSYCEFGCSNGTSSKCSSHAVLFCMPRLANVVANTSSLSKVSLPLCTRPPLVCRHLHRLLKTFECTCIYSYSRLHLLENDIQNPQTWMSCISCAALPALLLSEIRQGLRHCPDAASSQPSLTPFVASYALSWVQSVNAQQLL